MHRKTISFLSASLLALGVCATGCADADGDGMSGADTGDAGSDDGDTGTADTDTPPDPSDGSTGGNDSDPDPDGSSSGDESDTTPPTIVSVSPADMDVGVDATTDIVITFSEPMDQGSAQAAYQSADIPAGAVTFSWNAAGDELTIDPNDDLEYAAGTDLEAVIANVYAYSVTTTATDLAGNNLEDAMDVEFSTAREISLSLELDPALTGDVSGSGVINMGNTRAGDFADNTQVRGLLSFDLASLPQDPIEVVSATLNANAFVLGGQEPFMLGDLRLWQVSYAAVDVAAFDAIPEADLGVIASSPTDVVAADLTSTVVAGIAGSGLVQLRTSFPTATDGDGSPDVASLLIVSLDVVVLVE